MSAFEKGIAIWAVALAVGGGWLFVSNSRPPIASNSQPPVTTVQAQPAAPVPQTQATVVIPQTQPPPPDNFLRAKQAVTRKLKDPDSAKFGNLFEGRGGQTICGEVNAKNGYGGYNGMEPFAFSVATDEAIVVTIKSMKYMRRPASDFLPKLVKDYFRDCVGEEYDPNEADRLNAQLLEKGRQEVRRLQSR